MPAELTPNQLKWVEALESGEYKQGRGALHRVDTDEWCCLGVACDVAEKNGVKLHRALEAGRSCELFGSTAAVLPLAVAKWLGLRDRDADPDIDGIEATALNDVECASFATIASMIREHGLS